MNIAAFLAMFLAAGSSLAAEMIDPALIAAVTSGDFDKDGDIDLAMILQPGLGHTGDANGIYIYLADPSNGRMVLKVAAPNLVPNSFIYAGESLGITALQNGSILVTAMNDTPGQRRYDIRLTIAYRNSDFVVAGYSRKENVPYPLECDVNMLTGKGIANGKPISGKPTTILLSKWEEDLGQQACKG